MQVVQNQAHGSPFAARQFICSMCACCWCSGLLHRRPGPMTETWYRLAARRAAVVAHVTRTSCRVTGTGRVVVTIVTRLLPNAHLAGQSRRGTPAAATQTSQECMTQASCSTAAHLFTPKAAATFSLVTPMGIRQPCALGNCSTRGLMPPSQAMGLADMVSTPAARPTV